jgi:hypothetical protein
MVVVMVDLLLLRIHQAVAVEQAEQVAMQLLQFKQEQAEQAQILIQLGQLLQAQA